MDRKILKKLLLILLPVFIIALPIFFIWLKNAYAPREFQKYTAYYSNNLEICPNYASFPTSWILKQGFETSLSQAKADNTKAYSLAIAYSLGIGTQKDLNASNSWLSKAVSNNDPQAQYAYAALLYNQGNKKGLILLNKLSQANNTNAQILLAIIDNSTTQLKTLAANGNGTAQYLLAQSLSPVNNPYAPRPFDSQSEVAFQLALAAATNPNTPTDFRVNAIMMLANAYQNSQGTTKNLEAAQYWNQQLNIISQKHCDPFVK